MEYGYALHAVVEQRTTWLLAMTFSSLTGGQAVHPRRPHARSVDVAVYDGYYAMPYFREAGADTMLYVVDYRAIKGQPAPDIIHHEYRWDEVK